MLYERFETTRRCEVGKYGKNFREKEAEDLEKLTRLIQNKILHHPMDVLKKYDPDSEEGQRALALICEMFDLK
jgi:glutamyl-tRNA reductase